MMRHNFRLQQGWPFYITGSITPPVPWTSIYITYPSDKYRNQTMPGTPGWMLLLHSSALWLQEGFESVHHLGNQAGSFIFVVPARSCMWGRRPRERKLRIGCPRWGRWSTVVNSSLAPVKPPVLATTPLASDGDWLRCWIHSAWHFVASKLPEVLNRSCLLFWYVSPVMALGTN